MRNASPSAARAVRESGIPVEVCTLLTLRNLLGAYLESTFPLSLRGVLPQKKKLTKSPEVEIQ